MQDLSMMTEGEIALAVVFRLVKILLSRQHLLVTKETLQVPSPGLGLTHTVQGPTCTDILILQYMPITHMGPRLLFLAIIPCMEATRLHLILCRGTRLDTLLFIRRILLILTR